MTNRIPRYTLAALLFVLALAPAVTAQGPSMHSTYLTFSGAVRLPGVALPAGTYIFEVPAPGSQVVRVMSRDRRRSYFQGFTEPIERSNRANHGAAVILGESPQGTPPTVNAWWAENEVAGHAFIYR